MTQLPHHAASEVVATAVAVVKSSATPPADRADAEARAQAVVAGFQTSRRKYGEAGGISFLTALATLAGTGFHLAARERGTDPIALIDQLGINIEVGFIDRREFPEDSPD